MQRRTMIRIALVTVALMAPARGLLAQEDRLKKIEERLTALEQRTSGSVGSFDSIKTYLPAAFPILGIGLFCGLWARNTGRDFWLWLVAGLVFNLLTLIFILDAHEKDQKAKKEAAKDASKEVLDL